MTAFDRGTMVRLTERMGVANVLRRGRSLLESRAIVPLRSSPPSAGVTLVGVVRSRHADLMNELISQLPDHVQVHLHALDSAPAALAPHVRSTGPGPRMVHLRRLIEENHARGNELIITDDDVTFHRGNGAEFLEICRAGGFDLAQPSHALGSIKSFEATRAAMLSRARLAAFVEVGPLVWMSPRAQSVLLPLEIGAGMGWGVDIRWSIVARGRLRLGLIDGAAIVHHGPVASDYTPHPERAFAEDVLAASGHSSMVDLVGKPGPSWGSWRQRAPWSVGSET